MTIVFKGPGDLLRAPVQTVTCPINTHGAMGSGLALYMRKVVPGLYQDYRDRFQRRELRVGKCYTFDAKEHRFDFEKVLMFPTKDHWKNPSELGWIEEGLEYLVEHLATLDIHSLGLPMLGCGYGGLPVEDVEKVIYDVLDPVKDLDVRLFLPSARK